MPKRYQATSTNVEDYWQLFVNRRAYVLQSMRPHAESGRYYYFRPKAGKNGEAPSLAAETVRRHLEGDLTIGVYAMSPATQRCKWIAMDGDYKDSLKHLCELQWELQQQKVEAALEQSRRGAHLWIFGAQPLLARQCRLLISGLAQKLGIPVKGAGTAEGIEIFPKHDELKDGDFGNAIRGPLGIHRTISARFWFYGADYNLDNQLAFLKGVTKLSEEQLGVLLQKLGQPIEGEKKEIKPTPCWQYPAQQRQFHILDHLQVRRKMGRNWITRCPSCAAAGRDKSGDNLAISVDEPQKYICWAGCNKEMIRVALGCPIPEKREGAYAVG
ncbi:MAG: hypothetical protein ABI165_04990 [Bryobacteraceae bacterium]